MGSAELFESLFSGKQQLPALPTIYHDTVKLLNNPFTPIEKLANLIKLDQAIVSQIIRLCNSPLFSARQEIRNLSSAITYLGTGTIKEMLLQISLVKTFKFADENVPQFDLKVFWEHSIGTAFLTEHIAEKLNIKRSEFQYLGGLLHDIGKLLIFHTYPFEFAKIVSLQIDSGQSDVSAERVVLNIDHADIGAFLAQKWHFSPGVVEMIRCHHFEEDLDNVDVCLVRIANHFAKAAGLCFPWEYQQIPIVDDISWAVLTQDKKQPIDVERMTFEIMDEAENVRETVRSMLS